MVLLISGSTRGGSTNTAALRTVQAVAPEGIEARWYGGLAEFSLKNLLDWTVGTGDLNAKPAAWLTVAPPGRGDGAAATLASVLGYVGAEVDEAICTRLPLSRTDIGGDGLVVSPEFRAGATEVLLAGLRHRQAGRRQLLGRREPARPGRAGYRGRFAR
ncbi:NADPH-dependent FMN reductase [Nocardia carnea]|uniref:NADPH-dependent FMN reductase n=1 Tax=Nocardia carnea TaxID=37328 RepID=UPI00245633D7|nr:NADPH-dependent FMN reductase [Nocardia carnea]